VSHIISYSNDVEEDKGEQQGDSLVTAIKESIPSVILMLYAFIAMWYIIGLCGYHVHLIAINQTTNEKIKEIWKTPFNNPFDRGSCRLNICDVLRGARYASRYNLWAAGSTDPEHISVSPKTEALKIDVQIMRVDNIVHTSESHKIARVDMSDEHGPSEALSIINVTEGTTTRGPSFTNFNKHL
jgi:hypothetical protein